MNPIDDARRILAAVGSLLEAAALHLARGSSEGGEISADGIDRLGLAVYDHAWMASAHAAGGALVEHAAKGGADALDGALAAAFAADAARETLSRLAGREEAFGLTPERAAQALAGAEVRPLLARHAATERWNEIAGRLAEGAPLATGLGEHHEQIRDGFRKFAEAEVRKVAEEVHRKDLLVPETVLRGLRDLGGFGISIPQRYGGFQDDARPDSVGMIVATEELSRVSLGIAGSLITRPEILSRALLKGGTEEQKSKWLPPIASGEKMVAVAVTEPDFGSDVAGLKVTARPKDGGWVLNGTKTWCTFAGRADLLMVLARTDPDPKKKHRGLSLFIAEKPPSEGHDFSHRQPGGGAVEGRAIGTIGYRGMHSYEVNFHDYAVPGENLIGGAGGLGRGFYLQMEGFAGGRLQTAARAVGIMQAAFESALRYAGERKVFGRPIADYPLSRWKLGRMAALLQASRQFAYAAARLVDEGKGAAECSMVKFFSSRVAEWVAREAMQLHGGMGYAEEFPVSRYFVDARVLSIFEGAEEVLALRVIARALLESALKRAA